MSIDKCFSYTQYLKGKIDFKNHPPEILDKLVELSKRFGKPLKFSSSFRTQSQNLNCGGSPTSSHLKGLAFDIICTNSSDRYALIKSIIDCGIMRFGVYKNFIHVDFDASKSQNVTWYG